MKNLSLIISIVAFVAATVFGVLYLTQDSRSSAPAAEGEADQQRHHHPDPPGQADHHENHRRDLRAGRLPAWRPDQLHTGKKGGVNLLFSWAG